MQRVGALVHELGADETTYTTRAVHIMLICYLLCYSEIPTTITHYALLIIPNDTLLYILTSWTKTKNLGTYSFLLHEHWNGQFPYL
jgi:hypothetical protein